MQKRNREKVINCGLGAAFTILLFFIIYVFYSNERFVLNGGDIVPHFNFAFSLLDLREKSFEEFYQSLEYPNILSYPGWHLMFLAIYYPLRDLSGYDNVPRENLDFILARTVGLEQALIFICIFWVLVLVLVRNFEGKYRYVRAYLYAMVILFVGSYHFECINERYYMGQFTPNPWHNPTTIVVKPFVLICFFLFTELFRKRNRENLNVRPESREGNKENMRFIFLSISMLISTFLKPSFAQLFVPALFVFCMIDVVCTKFKSFWFDFKTGLAVIPVCLAMLGQYWLGLNMASNNIYFEWFKVWGYYSNHITGSFLISLLFPIYVFAVCRKEFWKSGMMKLSALMLFLSVLQYSALYFEIDWKSADFIWGCYLSVFILFAVSAILLENYREKGGKKGVYGVGLLLLAGHLYYGIVYFCGIYQTGLFNF